MAVHQWRLMTPGSTHAADDFNVSAKEVSGTPPGWQVSKRTLATGLSQGVEIVEIDNGLMRTTVVPTRGMGVWRIASGDRVLGWQSPVRGPVHPAFVPVAESGGLGWLTGFDELMCRCGLESNGAPDFDDRGTLLFPLHGRIANLPAHELHLTIDDTAGTIALRGVVDESRFHYQKLRLQSEFVTRFHSNELAWNDEVVNFGGTHAGMQMLYHINIGSPQLDAGSRLVAPIAWVAPGNADTVAMGIENWDHYTAPNPTFRQQVYQLGLLADEQGNSPVLLKNSAGSSAVEVSFNVRQLPCFSLWRNLVAEADGYVTGIEPATNFPNPRQWEEKQGRVVNLQPGERWQASVALRWLLDAAEVHRTEQAIAARQACCAPEYHDHIYCGRAT
jgi:hypothetical protein